MLGPVFPHLSPKCVGEVQKPRWTPARSGHNRYDFLKRRHLPNCEHMLESGARECDPLSTVRCRFYGTWQDSGESQSLLVECLSVLLVYSNRLFEDYHSTNQSFDPVAVNNLVGMELVQKCSKSITDGENFSCKEGVCIFCLEVPCPVCKIFHPVAQRS